jgi:hypothetical protein
VKDIYRYTGCALIAMGLSVMICGTARSQNRLNAIVTALMGQIQQQLTDNGSTDGTPYSCLVSNLKLNWSPQDADTIKSIQNGVFPDSYTNDLTKAIQQYATDHNTETPDQDVLRACNIVYFRNH